MVAVVVEPGDVVGRGDPLVVLEAMKTETVLRADTDGRVAAVMVRPNDQVGGGDPLLVLAPPMPHGATAVPAGAARADLARLVGAGPGRVRAPRGLPAPVSMSCAGCCSATTSSHRPPRRGPAPLS